MSVVRRAIARGLGVRGELGVQVPGEAELISDTLSQRKERKKATVPGSSWYHKYMKDTHLVFISV